MLDQIWNDIGVLFIGVLCIGVLFLTCGTLLKILLFFYYFFRLVMLHGMLYGNESNAMVVERKEKVGRTVWESKLLANEHPTYYGMAVASISKKKIS